MKSKYIRPMPPFYKDKHLLKLKGARKGVRTAEETRDLIRPQAQVIISKFGGARELARTLKECSDDPNDHYSPSTIYRWMYPRSKGGCGGEIPTSALQVILKCARLAGVMLTTAEIYPHLVDHPETAEVD